MANRERFDVIIVGGGPAGLCAALYCGRGMLRTVVLEKGIPGGELNKTEWIEDYPGFKKIKGPELAKVMTEHAVEFGADVRQFVQVESIVKRPDGWFDVTTLDGPTYEAPAVILTAGGEPNKLGVPGEEAYAGKGVSYCAICDGAFFKGETIAVVGGGDAAVEEAGYLTRYADKVYVIHRRDRFRAAKVLQERLFANPKIEVVWNKTVSALEGDVMGLKQLVLEDTQTGATSQLPVTGCFIFIGFTPNSGLISQPFEGDESGYVRVNSWNMETSIPGLFAAGDLRIQLTKQVTTAVGDATTAAIAVEKYLTELRARGVQDGNPGTGLAA